MTLHERLRAAVEERKRVATEAADRDSGEWFMGDKWNVHRVESDAGYDWYAEHALVVFGNVKPQSEHIALNDPARVLRDCDRDLKVLERHVDAGVEDEYSTGWCRGCHANFYEEWAEEWPCPEIRDLADEYGVEVDA
jgi:hypothetical protein